MAVSIEIAPLLQAGLAVAHHLLLAIFSHEKSARIRFRPTRLDEANAVLGDDLIGCLCFVLYSMNLFRAEDGIGPRSSLYVFNGPNFKVGDHMVGSNFADRILVSKFVHRVEPEVCRHHVQRFRKIPIDRVGCIGEVACEELADDRPALDVTRTNPRD